MLDDAAVFLCRAGHETRYINEGDDRDVIGIAEADEAGGLDRALDVQAARQDHRLVGDDAHGLAFHAGEADDDVLGVVGLQLEEVAVIHRLDDQLLDVVGLVRVGRHQGVEAVVEAVGRVRGGSDRRLFLVIERQVVEEAAQHQERLDVVFESEVGNAGF